MIFSKEEAYEFVSNFIDANDWSAWEGMAEILADIIGKFRERAELLGELKEEAERNERLKERIELIEE